MALDCDAGTLACYKNNTLITTVTITGGVTAPMFPIVWFRDASGAGSVNFGQRAFAYTAPSGFQALVTTNLPNPTIGATSTTQANKYFDINLYTGTGSTQSITNSGSMQPDLIWGKQRNGTSSNVLTDAVRGTNSQLSSNSTNAQQTDSDCVTAFNSNGFTVGASTGFNMNQSGSTLVAWQWNAGGSTVTNTSGTISAQVRANTTSGFSIVTYTGTGSNATVGHGLGVAPQMVIVKTRSASGESWGIYHVGLTSAANAIYLNLTQAQESAATQWNSTAPTSSVFSVGTAARVNGSGATFVAYCFAPVAGYSAFGSFTGNGNADGPFVYLGFRPAFVMAKLSSATGDWNIVDDNRQTYNDASGNPVLRANLSSAEEDVNTMQGQMDLLSNGFKLRSNNSSLNLNGGTIIYAAFAEFPFRYSLAR
jgi:hypothetical protein